MDYSCSLEDLLRPPVVCYTPRRSVRERFLFRYGLMCKIDDRLRTTPRVLPLGGGVDPEGGEIPSSALSKALVYHMS